MAGTIGHEALTLTGGPARGTIGFNRKLDMQWVGNGQPEGGPATRVAGKEPAPVRISGTLAHPVEAAERRATLVQASH